MHLVTAASCAWRAGVPPGGSLVCGQAESDFLPSSAAVASTVHPRARGRARRRKSGRYAKGPFSKQNANGMWRRVSACIVGPSDPQSRADPQVVLLDALQVIWSIFVRLSDHFVSVHGKTRAFVQCKELAHANAIARFAYCLFI